MLRKGKIGIPDVRDLVAKTDSYREHCDSFFLIKYEKSIADACAAYLERRWPPRDYTVQYTVDQAIIGPMPRPYLLA